MRRESLSPLKTSALLWRGFPRGGLSLHWPALPLRAPSKSPSVARLFRRCRARWRSLALSDALRPRSLAPRFALTPPRQTPRTIDNARELDETVVLPGDDEVLGDEADDEFSAYFSGAKAPKIMITTKMGPSGVIFRMIAELMAVLPNSFYYRRGASRARVGQSS